MLEIEIRRATCRISCGANQGSGFLVGDELVITARHCVADAIDDSGVTIQLDFQDIISDAVIVRRASIVDENANLDVCLIRIDEQVEIAPIALSDQQLVEGTEWFSHGFPNSKSAMGHRVTGKVEAVHPVPVARIDVDVSIEPQTRLENYEGLSGAPLVAG